MESVKTTVRDSENIKERVKGRERSREKCFKGNKTRIVTVRDMREWIRFKECFFMTTLCMKGKSKDKATHS